MNYPSAGTQEDALRAFLKSTDEGPERRQRMIAAYSAITEGPPAVPEKPDVRFDYRMMLFASWALLAAACIDQIVEGRNGMRYGIIGLLSVVVGLGADQVEKGGNIMLSLAFVYAMAAVAVFFQDPTLLCQ